jgi:hypothetical protein
VFLPVRCLICCESPSSSATFCNIYLDLAVFLPLLNAHMDLSLAYTTHTLNVYILRPSLLITLSYLNRSLLARSIRSYQMKFQRNATPFEFDRPGVTTRSQTKATRKKMSRVGGCLSLTELPTDAQCCVLTFLACYELARYSELNRDCCAVATLDHLWEPLVAEQFAAVTMTGTSRFIWGSTLARQFSKLAQAACTVCQESVLKPDLPGQRYPGAYSCVRCCKLCCAACFCQCSCVGLCNVEKSGAVEVCSSCRGWCHWETFVISCCDEMTQCGDCENSFCEGCRAMSFCESCSESFCYTCRIVRYCESCEVSYCDSCGH